MHLIWNDNIYYKTLFHLAKIYVNELFMFNPMKGYD